MSNLFLIDGMSLVFRAYHAMFKSDLRSPAGDPSGAVFGFVNMITSLIEKENPDKISVVFDTREPTFRHKRYPEYKANRDAFPEDLGPQLLKIKEFLDIISVPRIEKPGYEADDIIGTLAKQASSKDQAVICITSDKDYYQLVDNNIKLFKPSRTPGKDFDIVQHKEVMDKFGVLPEQVIDVLALIGDSSDNVPGVKGVGEKTAIPLIQKYKSVENIYENIEEIERKALKTKLENNQEMALLSKELVTIITEVPLDTDYTTCKRNNIDADKLDKFFLEMGFTQLRNKWRRIADLEEIEIQTPEESPFEDIKSMASYLNYKLVDTLEDIDNMLLEIGQPEFLSVDLETSSLNKQNCDIVGIALSHKANHAFYVATSADSIASAPAQANDLFASLESSDDSSNAFTTIPINKAVEKLKALLENPEIKKIGQNIKFDAYILKRFGIDLTPIAFDTMIASYVLDPDQQHNMDAMAQKWLNYTPVPISKLIGEKKSKQKSMADLDPKDIKDYACEDADITFKLFETLREKLASEQMTNLAESIEFPVVTVLTHMEYNGVAIDSKALKEFSHTIAAEIQKLTADIFEESGTEFNIDSPKQLGHVLFEKMMIPPIKKTKTGYSTDVRVMTELAEIYPIAKLILDYRQLVKLKSTYVDALPKLVNPESGRIHTTYNQTVASTGRLSSTDPNLQNIPIRTELGRSVRKAFIPQNANNIILAADYSQIELRIMAHYCGDKHLIEAFISQQDVHSATAATLFSVPPDEVNSDQRRIAKTVNFGIMYGLGAFGLAQRLNINRSEASDIIKNYFEKYPGIKRYIDDTIEFVKQHGYAETKLGRRRYFTDINSKNRNIRTAAERAAINLPIQGTASDIIKIAMINICRAINTNKLRSLLMLQVHDELVFEVIPEELETLKTIVLEEMQNAYSLGEIPLICEIGTGKNWFEAH